jgi:protein phosphatase
VVSLLPALLGQTVLGQALGAGASAGQGPGRTNGRGRAPAGALEEAEVLDALRQAVSTLNGEVRLRGAQHVGLRGLGATVVLALLCGELAYIAHLGDSRAYLLRGGRLRRLTLDHTVANLLAPPSSGATAPRAAVAAASAGEAAPPGPAHGAAPHRLARYVGMGGAAMPDVQATPLEPDDRLLLCSDGLTSALPDRMIAHLLRRQAEPDAACRVLVGAANEVGGRDNVSVAAIYVDAGGTRSVR